ncbi:MAG: antirestriction protein ArdA [Alphaproteobacteria bacterium]
MTLLHAHPYDISAQGFLFNSVEQYEAQAKKLRNDFGAPVEEFEIQFIDGELIDAEFAKAFPINQGTFRQFLELVEEWDDDQKTRFIIAVGECGYGEQQFIDDPDAIDLDIYELDSLKDLAEQFVEEGLFGDIPERLQFYIDYDAIARDLGVDYAEISIDNKNLIYRCG